MDLGPAELVGRSCYQFVHGQDAARIRQSHLDREDPPLPVPPQASVPAPQKSCLGVITAPPVTSSRGSAQRRSAAGSPEQGLAWWERVGCGL